MASVLLATPASAFVTKKDAADCTQDADADRELAGCARMLNSSNLPRQQKVIAHNNRCNAFISKRDIDGAISECDQAIELNPKYALAYSLRCVAFLIKREYARAIADCDAGVHLQPNNANIRAIRCNALEEKADVDRDYSEYARAVADCDEALRLNPKYALPYMTRCLAHTRMNEFDAALPDCDRGIQLSPSLAVGYVNRGSLFLAMGEFDRAISDFNEAIRLAGGTTYQGRTYRGRGRAWHAKGEFERAMADYNEGIMLDPKSFRGYEARGLLWAEMGNFDRALADLDEEMRLRPTAIDGYETRAKIWEMKGDYDRALADINEAIRVEPVDSFKPYGRRGEIWRLKGDLDRALADQDTAIRLYDPTRAGKFGSAGLYAVRGDTLRYRDELDRALADYNEALRQVPDFIPAFTGRGLTYEKMNDLSRAHEEFERALASKSSYRSLSAKDALETAKAHLAALASGAPRPVIPAAPAKAASKTSIPTPEVVVPAAVIPSPAVHPRRVALIIGNSAYQNVSALPNPQHDADKVAATLRAIGFDTVTLANNATHQAVNDALRNFADATEQSDWAMVYYAGHGIEVGGVNYLIPVDAKLLVDRDVQFEAVPLDQIMAALEGAKKLKLVLLDACRDNPFAPTMRRTAAPTLAENRSTAGAVIATRSVGRGLADVKVSGATLVVYAAKGGQVALDGEGEDSPRLRLR